MKILLPIWPHMQKLLNNNFTVPKTKISEKNCVESCKSNDLINKSLLADDIIEFRKK